MSAARRVRPLVACRHGSAAAALLVLATALPAAAQGTARPAAGPRDTTLANGLLVSVLEDHAVQLATVVVAVRNGASTQRPGEQGIAHVYEHLLFRTYRGDPSKFGQDASDLRAAYNGETGEDVVLYYMILPSQAAGKAIDQLGELVTRARFRQKDLDEELPVILDELARDASDLRGRLRRAQDRELWGADWHRKDAGGDSASLRGVTLARLQEYFDHYYVPNNSALVVSGDVDTRAVFRRAADRFDGWKRAEDPFAGGPPPSPAPLERTRVVVTASEAFEGTIRIAFRGPGVDTDPAAVEAMESLVDVLDAPGSPFLRELVANGPFGTLTCGFEPGKSAGTVVFEGAADLRHVAEAATRLSDALDRVGDWLTGVGTAPGKLLELDRALVLEVRPTLAPYMAELWARGEAFDPEPAGHASIDDMARVARRWIQEQPRVIGVSVPEVLADTVRSSIEAKEEGR